MPRTIYYLCECEQAVPEMTPDKELFVFVDWLSGCKQMVVFHLVFVIVEMPIFVSHDTGNYQWDMYLT